jgi:hypothetical protein
MAVHKILMKRGSTEERLKYTPEEGEVIVDTTTNEIFVGDGQTAGGLLIANCKKLASRFIDGSLQLKKRDSSPRFILEKWEDLL